METNNTNHIKVSIIIPSFNQAEYLESTLLSVIMQDYPNIELIVIDGGSSDGSVDIIKRYANKLSYWVSEPDNGQAEAINKGLTRASGDLVAWLNSDDIYLPGTVADAVENLNQRPDIGMVYANAITIDPSGKQLNKLVFSNYTLNDFMRFRIICQPAVFLRRSTLHQVGFLNEELHFMLDHQLWIRIAEKANILHVPGMWAAARHHPSAKNVLNAPRFSEDIYAIINWMQSHSSLSTVYHRDKRKILAGADRLAARYLLDGKMPAESLRTYFRSTARWPSFALKHWHRMLFAMLSIVGMEKAGQYYYQWKSSTKTAPIPLIDHENWPGIQ